MNVKLKICGVKTVEEAERLKGSGVDFIGLNFIPASPRCISLETAQSMLDVLRGSPVKSIALFQNQPLEMVNEYANQLGVDYVQLHGNETANYAASVQKPVMRAIAVDPAEPASALADFINGFPADYFVLDRQNQGRGEIVSTKLAAQAVSAAPDKICLAGGLNPDNLANVLAEVHPYAIDISSGIRTGDSIDMAKVRRCLEILHQNSANS